MIRKRDPSIPDRDYKKVNLRSLDPVEVELETGDPYLQQPGLWTDNCRARVFVVGDVVYLDIVLWRDYV